MLKKIWEWIKRPHGLALVLFYVFAAGCIAAAIVLSILMSGTSYGFIAYLFYGLAAISLGYTVYTVVIYAPQLKRKAFAYTKKSKFAVKVLKQYDFRTVFFSSVSLALTVAFALSNLATAIFYRSVWHVAFTVYYVVLVLFRSSVIIADRKMAKKYAENDKAYALAKWRIYLAGGAILCLLEIAMAGVITVTMLFERSSQGGMIMAIANAAYTFYKIVMAVYNLVKARKFDDPVVRALRNLNFADAGMSVVSLTALLLVNFGGDTPSNETVFIKSIVGFAACVAIIVLAVYMIVYANKRINRLKRDEERE